MKEKTKPLIKKRWIFLILVLLFLNFYQLPYYYSQPGEANVLRDFINVEEGDKDSDGSFMLTTVRMGRANPFLYVWAQLNPYRFLYPVDQIRFEGESDEDYNRRQLMAMSTSQESAKIVAYKKAGKEFEFTYHGVLVTSLIDGMPASDILKSGDRIIRVNGISVKTAEELVDLLADEVDNKNVELTINRNDEIQSVKVGFSSFPESYGLSSDKVGIGISGPMTDREVMFNPTITVDASEIGGPSAGLMFSLEIYDQLVNEDITKGYHIAGTGTIDDNGIVGRIGGAGQKVIAADKAGASFFFAPNEGGREGSNYQEALEAAEYIDSEMEIIPIDTFEDALDFLESL